MRKVKKKKRERERERGREREIERESGPLGLSFDNRVRATDSLAD